jgi:hypothetical protein
MNINFSDKHHQLLWHYEISLMLIMDQMMLIPMEEKNQIQNHVYEINMSNV